MSKPFIRAMLLTAAFCTGAIAQTPAPAKPLNLRIVKGASSTLYLDGARPIARMAPKGLTSYVYANGRRIIAMRTDGKYAHFKYENGKLDRIEYSDGTVRRAGERLTPSTGSSIAARGGAAPMNWDGDGWGGWDDDEIIQDDDRGGGWGGGGMYDGGGGGGFPEEAEPDNPIGRLKCLYDSARMFYVSVAEFCPYVRDQMICIGQAMNLKNEADAWCLRGVFW